MNVNAEHPLFILYTSGSTGKPKGVQHSTGGYLLWAMLTMKWVFDNKPNDVFWCTADVGWVTGHTCTYGPLAVGATEVMFEASPRLDAGRFWKIIQDHKVNVFYTAPTAIRSLIKAGGDLPPKIRSVVAAHPRHGGRADQSRGLDVVPRDGRPRPLPDRRHVVADRDRRPHDLAAAEATPTKPSLRRCRCPASSPTSSTRPDNRSARARRHPRHQPPWPAMLRTIWGDPDRYVKTYWPDDFKRKLYLAGDGASTDEDGYFRIVGRIDDVLNVSGHRLGTMEIESALVAHKELVAEAAVVGRPDDLTGKAVVAASSC